MKTIFIITNRNFATLQFAQKFADKNNLDHSLISERQIPEYKFPSQKIYIGKESQEKYNERRANKNHLSYEIVS
jgi:hypothetical protein